MTENPESADISKLPDKVDSDITFVGLAKATVDSIQLTRSHRDKMTASGALALVGMKAAFPEKFSNQQLLQNQNLRFYNCLVWLGVEINDAVDINPSAREAGKQEVVEKIFEGWKNALRATKVAAGLNPQETESSLQIMDSYQREILFVEKSIRERSEDHLNLEVITSYRELVNAISVFHNAAALLEQTELKQRQIEIPKQELSLERLQNKYEWLISGSYQSDTERKLIALFNSVMGVQVIDDWFDAEDDQKLGLHTFATEIVRNNNGNANTARKEVFGAAKYYFDRSEEFGFSKFARTGMDRVFRGMKKFQKLFPHRAGGRREKLLNEGESIITDSSI